MNAYQIPTFNAGPTTASPFNYFPQNSHSYAGVISSSYGTGSPVRTVAASTNLNPHHHHAHSHKTTTMTSSQSAVAAAAAVSSFVTPSNYFHQSHHPAHHPHTTHHPHHPLQPFSTTFAPNTTVQTSSGTTNPYAHNHYSAYSNGSSTSNSNTNNGNNMANNTNNDGVNNNSNSGQNSFDYGQNYNSITNNSTVTSGNAAIVAATAAAYPYGLTNCSSNNYSSPYSPNSIVNNSPNNGNNSSNSTYQSTNNTESYLSLCNNNNRGILDNNEDIYTLNIKQEHDTSINSNGNNDGNNGGTSLPPIKKVKRNGRGRTRKQINNPSPSSPESNIDRIFIWYIDETILSYLTISEYNRFAGFNDTLTTSLYNEMFMFINKFAEKYLFLSDLKDIDQSHIDDSAADDNGQDLSNYNFTADGFKASVSCNMGSTLNSADLRQKMALRYRKISETYSNYCDKLDELFLDKADYEQLQDLLKRFDSFSKNWIHPAIKALSFIKTRPNCLNVLISSSPLIYTLAKLMVFNLGPYFSIGNVYSCSKTSKEHTLNRVLSRFGSSCTYIVIGKGSDEQQLSQKLELPFWPVTEREHFESLLNAMHYFF